MKALGCAALLLITMSAIAQSFSGAKACDDAINQAMHDGVLPGAVLIIGHDGKVVYRKAYGERSVMPDHEQMTVDTIFDIASLTKVVATIPCLMRLYEQGRFRLSDRVTEYLPEFQGGHSNITIRDLMTHFSGLRPDVPLTPRWQGYEHGIHLALTLNPELPPGKEHIYSDINFELLGELIHRLSGQMENVYAEEHVFKPLGMHDTMYLPPKLLIPRIAPTEVDADTGIPFRGVVHDPTARYMGGVAGHAGVFATADDLAKYCQLWLNEGELNGVRIFHPLTGQKFTEPQTPPDQPYLRGLGWDIDSPYSSNRGELFPIGSYGHSGFTGTSIWIDPTTKTYVILLANAVHPHMRPSILPLRSKIATIAAAAEGIKYSSVSLNGYNETRLHEDRHREIDRVGHTLTGLDVLETEHFAPLIGKRVGLITNQTGLDREGRRNIDVMRSGGVNIVKLFSPEHGFYGAVDHPGIGNTVDSATGIEVDSLYGKTLRPTPDMLKGLDALVFDIQDVGVRFYTYETTMAYAMEAAAKAGIPYYVLDRPNPITGVRVEGPLVDASNTGFVGYLAGTPVRHGMTMGEIAEMDNDVNHIGANLTVIKMQDWERGDWYDATSLPWVNPSPNMRSLNAAMLYPGLCFMEPVNISVGRGTDDPFEQIGADFIDGPKLAAYLNRQHIEGVRAYPTSFTPSTSKFEGQHVQGLRFEIANRERLDATELGLEVACAIQRLFPGKVDWNLAKHIIGSDDVIRKIEAGVPPWEIENEYQSSVRSFMKRRKKYLLY